MNQNSSHLRAIGFSLAGFLIWSVADASMKLAGDLHAPLYEIAGIGSVSGMAVIFGVTLMRRRLANLRPQRPYELVVQGILNTANYFILVWILPRLPLANFYTFTFLMPMTVAILAALFLHERLDWKRGVAILAGFGGVVFAVDPTGTFAGSQQWLIYGAAFAFMLTNALQMLTLRLLGSKESHECLAFYPRVMGMTVAIACGAIWGFAPMPLHGFFFAVISGIGGGIGWLCMAYAYKLAPAATVAPFHYSQLIAGALFGYLIWHDVPTLHVLSGAAVIIASGLYIATHAKKSDTVAQMAPEFPET